MEGLFNNVVRQWAVDLTGPHKTHRASEECGRILLAWSQTLARHLLPPRRFKRPQSIPLRNSVTHPNLFEVDAMKAAILNEFKKQLSIEEVARPHPERMRC